MTHTSDHRARLLTRIRRISGQAAGLEKMLLGDEGCLDVLQQIAAIRGAVNGLMAEVLEHHIVEHLGEASATQESRDADVQMVIKALRSYLK